MKLTKISFLASLINLLAIAYYDYTLKGWTTV